LRSRALASSKYAGVSYLSRLRERISIPGKVGILTATNLQDVVEVVGVEFLHYQTNAD